MMTAASAGCWSDTMSLRSSSPTTKPLSTTGRLFTNVPCAWSMRWRASAGVTLDVATTGRRVATVWHACSRGSRARIARRISPSVTRPHSLRSSPASTSAPVPAVSRRAMAWAIVASGEMSTLANRLAAASSMRAPPALDAQSGPDLPQRRADPAADFDFPDEQHGIARLDEPATGRAAHHLPGRGDVLGPGGIVVGPPDDDRSVIQQRARTRTRPTDAPHLVVEVGARVRPIQPLVALLAPSEVRPHHVRLALGRVVAARDQLHAFFHQARNRVHHPAEYVAVGIGPADRQRVLDEDVAGVDPVVHEVGGDADLALAVDDRPVDDVAAAIEGQLARVHVEAAERHAVPHVAPQDL